MKKNEIKIGETYAAKVSDKVVPVRIDHEHPSGGWRGTNLKTNRPVHIKSAQRLRNRVGRTPDDEPAPGPAPGPAPAPGPGKKGPVKKRLSKEERDAQLAKARADQENARLRDEREKSGDGQTASERAMPESEGDGEVVVFRDGPGKAWRYRKGEDICPKRYMARSQAERAAAKAYPDATLRVDTSAAATPTSEENKRDTGEPAATRGQNGKSLSLIDAAAQVLAKQGEPMRCQAIVDAAIEQELWQTRSGKTPANTLYAAILREIKTKGATGGSRFIKADRGQFALAKKGA